MTLEDKKKVSDILVAWIGVFALIFAGIFTLVEYTNAKHKSLIEETLNYVRSFNSGELFLAQNLIAGVWGEHHEKLEELKATGEKKAIEKLVIEITSKKEMRAKVWLIVDFYESLATCVEKELCDKEASIAFFGGRALRFFNLHFPYIEAARTIDPSYGRIFEEFVRDYYNKLNST